MIYLLDTNACISVINGKPASVVERFARAQNSGAELCVCSIVAFELWYGAFKSQRREFNCERLELFFAGPIELLPFDGEDALAAAGVRASLEAVGTPIGAYDVLIAGAALRRGMTLVTANVREFSRVEGLTWEDWASAD